MADEVQISRRRYRRRAVVARCAAARRSIAATDAGGAAAPAPTAARSTRSARLAIGGHRAGRGHADLPERGAAGRAVGRARLYQLAETTLSRAAAGPLAVAARAWPRRPPARGSATCSATPSASWLSGAPATARPERAARPRNTAALAANTAALGALTAALGAAAAAGGASALGSRQRRLARRRHRGARLGRGRRRALRLPRRPLRLCRGGIVPSAAGGWALPNFPARSRRCCTPARWCCRRRSARACRT